jgi:hypothetical protein
MFAVAHAGATLLGQPAVFAFGTRLWAATEDQAARSALHPAREISSAPEATDKMYRSLADWLNWLPGGCCTNTGAS